MIIGFNPLFRSVFVMPTRQLLPAGSDHQDPDCLAEVEGRGSIGTIGSYMK